MTLEFKIRALIHDQAKGHIGILEFPNWYVEVGHLSEHGIHQRLFFILCHIQHLVQANLVRIVTKTVEYRCQHPILCVFIHRFQVAPGCTGDRVDLIGKRARFFSQLGQERDGISIFNQGRQLLGRDNFHLRPDQPYLFQFGREHLLDGIFKRPGVDGQTHIRHSRRGQKEARHIHRFHARAICPRSFRLILTSGRVGFPPRAQRLQGFGINEEQFIHQSLIFSLKGTAVNFWRSDVSLGVPFLVAGGFLSVGCQAIGFDGLDCQP